MTAGSPSPTPDVAVCVVNWRTTDEALVLAGTLDAGTDGLSYELCIVDNASGDQSSERLKDSLPRARIVDMGRNAGFGSGANRAAAETAAPFLMILNPDTKVRPGAVRVLKQYLDDHPDAALVAPSAVHPVTGVRHDSARRFPTASAALFRGTPLGRLFPANRFSAGYLMTDTDFREPTPVDWVSGSAMMVRRSAFEQVGGFDERFFMYCEDMDLCKRLWEAGWQVVLVPGAVIEHRIGAASDKAQAAMIRAHHDSMLRYYRKHVAPHLSAWLRPLYPCGIALRHAMRQARRWHFERLDRKLAARREREGGHGAGPQGR